jgi:hypothetical protein
MLERCFDCAKIFNIGLKLRILSLTHVVLFRLSDLRGSLMLLRQVEGLRLRNGTLLDLGRTERTHAGIDGRGAELVPEFNKFKIRKTFQMF